MMFTGFVIGDRGLGASGDTHPAWMMAHAEAGPYLVVGASAAGQLHLARELPRDDAFVIRSVGPWLAVAVADGVGSRPLSRYGATYVVESLTSQLLRSFAPSTKSAKDDASSAKVVSTRKDLAPRPTIEELKLTPGEIILPAGEKGSLWKYLSLGLPKWKQKQAEPSSPALHELSSEEFLQVASVGWWPSSNFAASLNQEPSGFKSFEFKQPKITTRQDEDVTTVQLQSVTEHPSLIPIVCKAFDKSHQGLMHHAESLGLALEDLSCTALALLLNTETGIGAVGQVGDGAILGLTMEGKVEELVQPLDTGDPQSTHTINQSNFSKYLAVNLFESSEPNPFIAFYVMSDGISGDLLYSSHPLEVWAQPINDTLLASPSPAQAAVGMLNWLATYQIKGSWDDRTLVVITQREGSNGNRKPATRQQESTSATDHP